MNKKVKMLACLLMIIIMTLAFSYHKEVCAASVVLSVPDSVTVGDTITAKITGSAEQWNLTLSANETVIAKDDNLTNEGSEKSLTASATYEAKTEGTITFTLIGSYAYTSDNTVVTKKVNETKTVEVKAKEVKPEPSVDEQKTDPEPQPPVDEQKPDPEPEPTFQEVNETVYITGTEVNLRASYTTASQILKTLSYGTELTRIGIGIGNNEWSKVNYQGTIGYISSKYLTTTKPEEKPTEEQPQEEKSNNANLKSLVVENHDIIPSFSSSTTSYTMQVKNDVTELNIRAEAEDAKARVSIKGEKDLKEGENIVTISVSAEDGTIKIYEIKVTKLPETTLGLQSLNIEGTDIENEFQPDIYEYEIHFRELTKLNIEAIANEETAKVEIIGNEDLEEGENIITIIVSSEDESEKVTYQIKAKKLVSNTTKQEENKNIDSRIYLYIGIGGILLIALIIVIVYTIKHRKQEVYEEDDDDFDELPGELPERQQDKYFSDEQDNDGGNNKRGKHF